jgi:phage tail sheath protein FI
MFYGGFDGVNILDRDQRLLNDRATSTESGGKAAGDSLSYQNLSSNSSPGTGKDNNSINAYRTAGSIITDPMASRVNIVAVPGIRESFITDHISDLTRDYSKAIYLMDIPAYNDNTTRLYDDSATRANVRKSIEQFEARNIDNNYVATYFPDVIKEDPINGDGVTMPASIAALGALAYNDSVSYPWFAPAGFNRGALSDVMNTDIRLNTEDRNLMYEARINPIANFPNGGFVIFGQKTLQQAKSALDRVNVRRMLLEVKRKVSDVANKFLFEQNTKSMRTKFIAELTPLLSVIQSQQGIDKFKIVMDETNNTQFDIEQNKLNGRIVLVPTRAVEFISIDFIITNSGVSFD